MVYVQPSSLIAKTPVTSKHQGMGSIVFENGTAFRVWAPFAKQVDVAFYKDENQKESEPQTLVELASEGNGYWSGDVEGIKPGQLYRYRLVNNSSNEVLWKIDPYAKDVTNSVGKAIVSRSDFGWTDRDFRMPDYNSLVIYELHLGTFNDTPQGEPGTLAKAIERLPYLRDLGINCINIMPTGEFAASFSWGYNPAFPFALESAYGHLDDFKHFVNTAHNHGIAVIMDCVYNHFGPSDLGDGLWRFDGWGLDKWGGIYFYNDGRAITPWGDTRPDFGRPEVRQYLRDNAIFWLDECHCDGLRLDSTSNIWGFDNGKGWNNDGFNLLRWISDEVKHFFKYPRHKIVIAEDWNNDGWLTKSTSQWGAGMDAEWHWFVHSVRHELENPLDEYRNMNEIATALYARNNGDAFKRVIYTESHDETANGKTRVNRQIDPNNPESWVAKKRSTLGAAIVLTAPGIPMIWQGQEFLEVDSFSDQDPLEWDRIDRFAGIHDLYQRLCQLRRNWENNTRGLRGQHINCQLVDNLNKVIAYHRWDQGGPGDDVIVILNFSNRYWDSYRVGLPRLGTWWCRFSSDWKGYSNDFSNFGGYAVSAEYSPKDGMAYSAGFALAPYSALIYSQ
ncbi:alpha-amylase family glycosyl hydrolase [Aerosakkonemataceae cyanobacterium BLCC-F50]|uniref:1,4-alpha-glucan branching enzyme n=1 Tax=Floridaenema flaviceps BLCC-F50 TaxID=3153642 RepID=A0ABV4Y5M3_9CYAN